LFDFRLRSEVVVVISTGHLDDGEDGGRACERDEEFRTRHGARRRPV
jgi:hypothetical protein